MRIPFDRMWAKRLFAIFAACLCAVVIAGVGYEQLSRIKIERAWSAPPRGRLECAGEGSPTVLFFTTSGVPAVGEWSPRVQPVVATFARVCRRTGVPNVPYPRTAERLVAELHDALQVGHVGPPYVLVGFSMGGLSARWFDASYPREVAGFVFVDSSHPHMEDIEPGPRYLRRLPSWEIPILREAGVLRLEASGDLPGWLSRYVDVGSYPRRRITAYFSDYQIAEHSRRLDWGVGALESRPVVVLTKDVYGSDAQRKAWMRLQDEIAALSGNSQHQVVPNAHHAIWVDDPDAVTQAIRAVVASVRNGSPLSVSTSP